MSAPRDTVFLTFDDGPDPRWTPMILDRLAACDAHASFFVIAPRAAAAPELIARMQAEGHAIELHCDEHVRHTDLEEAELTADTARALERLLELGVAPTRWRTPWGVTRPHTHRVARAFGLELVHWTADTEDWAGHAPAAMLDRVAPALEGGAVVLAHDGLGPGSRRTGSANTLALIDPLVTECRDRELTCRALDAATTSATGRQLV